MDFGVFNNGTEVGNISKQFLSWGDTYVIRVFDAEFEEALIALLIAVDNIKDGEENH